MHIYLPGPAGNEQLAEAAQLEARGYRVECYARVMARDLSKQGIMPSPGEAKRLQLFEMLRADAVVLNDNLPTREAMAIMRVCGWAHIRVIAQDELPALCPHVIREDEVMDALNVATLDDPAPMTWREVYADVRAGVERFATWFDTRCGWFFRNGNKPPVPRPYPTPETRPAMTH